MCCQMYKETLETLSTGGTGGNVIKCSFRMKILLSKKKSAPFVNLPFGQNDGFYSSKIQFSICVSLNMWCLMYKKTFEAVWYQ